ncbi:hypothetical protein O181_010057 [Austropuccinia psidii MF-1]|uniref:Uncharacterized protein n=1 Tax=Austropuccinia psidii MF-1 TaxID=1389203 RepID=A0A9Q3BSZ6_9BASI|nr:hypothetical protein [Austropuccinia psidii MF-1]
MPIQHSPPARQTRSHTRENLASIWVTSFLRQDDVNCHRCHMRMSLKAQTHFHTMRNVWVITPHGATQHMLLHQDPTPDETPTLPPHLRPHHSLRFRTPASSSPCIKILKLPRALNRCASDATNHPYACIVPAQHASDTAYHPYACIVPSRHASNATYHPYARSALPTCLQCFLPSLRLQCPPNMPLTLLTILTLAVPSQHASDTTYHPYACSALPTCLQCCLPSLRSYSALPTCLPCCLPYLRS